MKLKSLFETVIAADSVRMLTESAPHTALFDALSDLEIKDTNWALIGGLAVGFRATPRGTQDIDILVASDSEIDQIISKLPPTFKKIRPHAIEHRPTGAEVELITPEFVGISSEMVQMVLDDATIEDMQDRKIPVASASGLIALKFGRASRRDLGDIEDIVKKLGPIDISKYNLPPEKLKIYDEILRDVAANE